MNTRYKDREYLEALQSKTELIPPETPYSIVICASGLGTPYRVEGKPDVTGAESYIFGGGSRAGCDMLFDDLKNVLIGQGNYVREVGCARSKTQVPRQMLINYTPYEVWKAIYRNLCVQEQVRADDRILTEGRNGYPNFTKSLLLGKRV